MTKLCTYRSIAIVAALAALAFTASGVPDNKGTDAAIGWFAFLGLALVFLALAGAAVLRRLRESRTAPARPFTEPSTRPKKIT
jgi:hypothetical protein